MVLGVLPGNITAFSIVTVTVFHSQMTLEPLFWFTYPTWVNSRCSLAGLPCIQHPPPVTSTRPINTTNAPAPAHRSGRQLRRVVIDVRHGDDGGGGVGQPEVQVALHVGGLDDDSVLGDFLQGRIQFPFNINPHFKSFRGHARSVQMSERKQWRLSHVLH